MVIGFFDDLVVIVDFCQEYDFWFYVDGVYGVVLVFFGKYKDWVKGIELVDFVVMDFYKMLLIFFIIIVLIFKDGKYSY